MPSDEYRYFLTYSGVKLPLNLVNPLAAAELGNRNTYIRARFDAQERLTLAEKMVYGEVELAHVYQYYPNGALKSAEITMEDETTVMEFDMVDS